MLPARYAGGGKKRIDCAVLYTPYLHIEPHRASYLATALERTSIVSIVTPSGPSRGRVNVGLWPALLTGVITYASVVERRRT